MPNQPNDNYIPRTLGQYIESVSNAFPVLLITGPRQVGKSTLLESYRPEHFRHVTLDDLDQRALAQEDPALFLQANPPPLLIDEIQYAPQLFDQFKIVVDQQKKNGLYWLTGSQKFKLMRGVKESLAGRVAILECLGFSQSELDQRTHTSKPFLPTHTWIQNVELNPPKNRPINALFEQIWLGSFPRVILQDQNLRDIFYNSYIQTYVQRDLRGQINVEDEMAFLRVLRAAAARTGQLLNIADMSKDVGVDAKTVKSWLSVLESSGLIMLLQPYHTNLNKRMVKTPKLYFLDTGLCSYLCRWSSPETLQAGAMSGAIFETFVISEVVKSYWHNAKEGLFYFYRDKDGKEVDLLINQDNKLYPIEIKKSANPSQTATKHFSALKKLDQPIGDGGIICCRETPVVISEQVIAIPVGYL